MTNRKFTHPDHAGPDHPGYVTRDGRPARIICTDAKGESPVVGLTSNNHGDETCSQWTARGLHERNAMYDLFDAPKPKKRGVYERWVNIYASGAGAIYERRERADYNARKGRIACINIRQEWEEGEGL